MVKTVKMERDRKAANVHPNEVENFRLHGWALVAKTAARKKAAVKPKPANPNDKAH